MIEGDPITEDRRKNANKLIRNHMAWSMGAGLIPVPIADFFAVGAIQLDMIRQLCKLYDTDFRENDGKAIISALTGSGLARLGAQAIKFIPGAGSVVGGISMSILSGASTYAIGEVFKKHFDTGGTILDFDSNRLKKMYNDLFEKGKSVASEMKNEQESATPKTKTTDPEWTEDQIIQRISELGDLKEKGVLNESEFQSLKKSLIDKFTAEK